MISTGRATGTVGYNLQAAVDAERHLIVAHQIVNVGHDRTQLAPMALKPKASPGADHLTALADRGSYNATQILACEQAGIIPLVLKPLTSNSKAEGRSNSSSKSMRLPVYPHDVELDHEGSNRLVSGEVFWLELDTIRAGDSGALSGMREGRSRLKAGSQNFSHLLEKWRPIQNISMWVLVSPTESNPRRS